MDGEWPSDSTQNDYAVSHTDFALTGSVGQIGETNGWDEMVEEQSINGNEYFRNKIGFDVGTYFAKE